MEKTMKLRMSPVGGIMPLALIAALVFGGCAPAEEAPPSEEEMAVPTTGETRAPRLLDQAAAGEALSAAWSAEIQDEGVHGIVILRVEVGPGGEAVGVEVDGSSGEEALDALARRVAASFAFEPALEEGRPVAAPLRLPVVFGGGGVRVAMGGADPEATGAAAAAAAAAAEEAAVGAAGAPGAPGTVDDPRALAAEPTFTPFTDAPQVTNRTEIQRALERQYPPALRDQGIGGTVIMQLFVDETGLVQNTTLGQSSGHPALDEAAERVAYAFEFQPARNRDNTVPVWIRVPITFTTR